MGIQNSHSQIETESEAVNPNKLSVDLVKCLIGIFLKLNQTMCKSKGSTNLSKQTLTCINSKGLVSKATFSCKTPVFPFNDNSSYLDPYEILPEPDANIRDIGAYKNFMQITKHTLDTSRFSECLPVMRRLRYVPAGSNFYLIHTTHVYEWFFVQAGS